MRSLLECIQQGTSHDDVHVPHHPTTPIHLFTDDAIGRKDGRFPSTGPGTEDYSRRNENNPQQAACAEPRYYGTCSIPTDDKEEEGGTEVRVVL
jgi:hypothetical protein